MRNKIKSPVAKFMRRYNKAATFADRTKYNRKEKHKGHLTDPYFMTII